MADCKACGNWFSSAQDQDLCSVCERALKRLGEYVAPVVRCRDCKFAAEEGGYEYLGQADTHINCTKWLTQNHARAIMPKNGFCSEGKRRSDCG